MSKTPSGSNVQEAAGFVGGLVKQTRLAWRLLNDGRVPAWVKLIPFAGLVYFLSPIDLIPDLMLPGLGEIDDVVVLLLALKMFVDLSPSGVVREHLEDLLGRRNREGSVDEPAPGPYIDAPYRIVDEEKE